MRFGSDLVDQRFKIQPPSRLCAPRIRRQILGLFNGASKPIRGYLRTFLDVFLEHVHGGRNGEFRATLTSVGKRGQALEIGVAKVTLAQSSARIDSSPSGARR